MNAIETNKGLRFIDWEGIGFGGLYSDIYNFVFVERYYGRSSEHFSDELEKFLVTYRHTVRSSLPNLQKAANLCLIYARRLYYFERICLLLERDVTANLCQVVLKSIELFKGYDIEKDESISLAEASLCGGHSVLSMNARYLFTRIAAKLRRKYGEWASPKIESVLFESESDFIKRFTPGLRQSVTRDYGVVSREALLSHFGTRFETDWPSTPSVLTDLRLELSRMTGDQVISRANAALAGDIHPSD